MFSLQRIAVEEGGGAAGMRAAVNYAKSCFQEKTPGWVRYNHRTCTAKSHYVVGKSSDVFERSWTSSRQWSMSSQGVGNAAQGSTARGSDGNDIPSVHTTEHVPPSVAAKVQQQQVSVPSPRQIPKASVSAIMVANTTNVTYTNITAQAEQVLANVETDARWAWAKRHC